MKTRTKIFYARILYFLLKSFFPKKFIIQRNQINYNINLNEAIDLYLFIFGKFEYEITKFALDLNLNKFKKIIDIGANFGVQTLQFARAFKESQIFSFEPTNYAFDKFKDNLSVNPSLSNRVFLDKYFISNDEISLPKKIYSSWDLFIKNGNFHEQHNGHMGLLKKIEGAKRISLDDYTEKKKIKKVDFIKLDVDGYELFVLKSGQNFLKTSPPIFMELAPYLYRERGYSFEELIDFLRSYNYSFYNIKNKKKIELNKKFLKNISFGSSINILVKP